MNISQLIIQLQTVLNQSTDPETNMIVSKAIKKIGVGEVVAIQSLSQLPSLPLAEDGHIYLDESSKDLYYNIGTKWYRFPVEYGDALSSWGQNILGEMGNEPKVNTSSPVTVVGGIANWAQVAAGANHSVGVTDSGIAYAWGAGGSGRLGNGSTVDRSSPVTVIGGIANWAQVSAGFLHSLGVTTTGVAYAWGSNGSGRLGDGTTVAKSSPVTVVGGITDWAQVSNSSHSLGVTATGVAYGWGDSSSGQLGDGTTVAKSSPVSVIGGIANWAQVSAGGAHSLGITENGIAYAWGCNNSGHLGDGTTANRSSPVTVVGGITNWAQVSAGNNHSLGITATGVAYAWGVNSSGRLGDNTVTNRSSPVTVVGGITNWAQVSAGDLHSLGVTSTGISYAWGNNINGQLGDGTTVSKNSPITVVGGIADWTQVAAGSYFNISIYKTQL